MTEPKRLNIPCPGYSVVADWHQGTSQDEILLSLTGWNSHRKKYAPMLQNICQQTGMSILAFDYSGHGESPLEKGDTRPAQHFLEVICAFDWLKEHYPNAKVTVMGSSYGGFLAVQLTKYRAFDRLVLRVPSIYEPSDFYTLNSALNSDDAMPRKIAFRKNREALAKHPLLARASEFPGKTLVVVHEKDDHIPTETTDAYIHAFHADSYVAKGFLHNLGKMPQDKAKVYEQAIIDWLKK
jgi:uncharacterized protein